MKISGIAGGKNRGEVVQLSEDKKVEAALGEGLNKWAETYEDGKYLAFYTDISVDETNISPHGDLLKKKWENNVYYAKGTCKLHLRNKEKDTLLEPRTRKFSIKFYDALDSMGLPDLEIDSLTIK